MGARDCAGRRERRGDARREVPFADRTPADAADSGTPQQRARRRAPQAEEIDIRAARKPAATCATCGGPLPNSERQFCDDCLPGERQQLEIHSGVGGCRACQDARGGSRADG